MAYNITPGEVLVGSSSLKRPRKNIDRLEYFLRNIEKNKALQISELDQDHIKTISDEYRTRYIKYRTDWKNQPRLCIKNRWGSHELRLHNILPLCIDIEVAAICDLACPFCHRQYIATPDKLIRDDLCFNLIDQAADLGVPSIKFNLRGEPLLHSKLPDFVRYAKERGILETGINTNATQLTEKCAIKLIEAGLDILIYSFDGGKKETYEAMRPGRFKKNHFEKVYKNIARFSRIRKEMGSPFPFTKIQMILTEQTFPEIDDFFDLFSGHVDDVSVSQYQERGGSLESLSSFHKQQYERAISKGEISASVPYRADADGAFFVSDGRIPCEQPFQRLTVTYEGRVGMCCIDWGVSHLIGYADKTAFDNEPHYDAVLNRSENRKRGFELLGEVKPLDVTHHVEKGIKAIKDIWYGDDIQKVRENHYRGTINKVDVCSNCTYVDTYKWKKISEQT